MPVPNVIFKYANNALGGTNPTNDGVAGLIIQVPVAPTGLLLGVVKAVNTLADAEALGLTADFDTANNVSAYGEIRDFYSKTGGKGELWLMCVSDTTSMADICDQQNTMAAKLLMDSGGRICFFGVAANRAASYTPDVTKGIDADVFAAAGKAQELRTTMALQRYIPVRVILPGRAFGGDESKLDDLKKYSDNGVQITLHGRKDSKEASIGLMLGLVASLPVQRNIGRVLTGDLGITEAYLTDGVTRAEDLYAVQDAINDKGYVIPIVRTGRAGYYYNDDPTATSKADDYSSLSNGRVMDKVQRIAYDVYLDRINDDFALSPDGKISPADLKALQGDVEDAVNATMVSGSELSSFECYVDPAQDPIATGETKVQLAAQPRGYYKKIVVELGFTKSQTQ